MVLYGAKKLVEWIRLLVQGLLHCFFYLLRRFIIEVFLCEEGKRGMWNEAKTKKEKLLEGITFRKKIEPIMETVPKM